LHPDIFWLKVRKNEKCYFARHITPHEYARHTFKLNFPNKQHINKIKTDKQNQKMQKLQKRTFTVILFTSSSSTSSSFAIVGISGLYYNSTSISYSRCREPIHRLSDLLLPLLLTLLSFLSLPSTLLAVAVIVFIVVVAILVDAITSAATISRGAAMTPHLEVVGLN